MPNDNATNLRRKINARASALRSIGKSDDQVLDSVLQFSDLPEGTRSIIKNAKAEGRSKDALDQLIAHTSQGISDPGIDTNFKTKGVLGGVSDFLGIEKVGRRAGFELAKLDPQYRKNVSEIQDPNVQAQFGNGGVSNREALGSGAELGLNLVGGSVIKGGARALGYGGKALGLLAPIASKGARALTTAQKAKSTVATLAKGVGLGYAQDVASHLNDNKSGIGAYTPGLGTATAGLVSGVPLGKKLLGVGVDKAANKFGEVVDLVAPKIVGKKGDKILGSPNVSIDAPGLFKKGKVNFSEDPSTLRIANSVEDVVNPKKTVSENVNLVKDAIKNTAESKVRPFLSDNKVPFHFKDLQDRLSQIKPSGAIKDDSKAYKTYSRIHNEMQDDIANFMKKSGKVENETDLNELWDARKVIDKKLESELDAFNFDSSQHAGVKAYARDLRGTINNFISDSLSNPGQAPELNKFYEFLNVARDRGMKFDNENDAIKLLRQQMGIQDIPVDVAKGAYFKYQLNQMSHMYEALGNLTKKSRGEIGKSKLDLYMKEHPIKTKLIGGGALLGAGAVGGALGLRTLGGNKDN